MTKLIQILLLVSCFAMDIEAQTIPDGTSKLALKTLNEWNDKMRENGILAKKLKIYRKFTVYKNMGKWFGGTDNYNEKDIFLKFFTDWYGAEYFLWLYPGLKGEPPVVSYNLSNDAADSVSDNITDFVCDLMQRNELYNKKIDNIGSLKAYITKAQKQLQCPEHPKVYVGLKKHPKFDAWLEKMDEKYRHD